MAIYQETCYFSFLDVKSARNMPENGSNTLIANFDSVEQYSFKDEAEFVIVDRISGMCYACCNIFV